MNVDFKRNKTIWAIFNEDDEEKLINIDGNQNSNGLMLPSKGIPDNPTNQNIEQVPQEGKEGFHTGLSGALFDN